MIRLLSITTFFALCLTIIFLCFPDGAEAQQIAIEGESGVVWFSRNDVRIPNEEGTKFDMMELMGDDAAPYYRIRLNVGMGDRHLVRVLYAPLVNTGTGRFDKEVFFQETNFQPDTPTKGTYRFNTYRLTWRYTFYDQGRWQLGGGLAGLIRDAKVELEQDDISDKKTDLGFVPLLHFYAKRNLNDRLFLASDVETLGSLQGRATDLALTLNYQLTQQWTLSAGYRLLEGGADVDEVYNFSWINYGLAAMIFSL